ncbi:MAG TPA: tetratricopeptide repeat protein [Candidatus Binataceae bacterium]|nr:tetratricopeptide repeat protein [Candidatus Binataceae bacterium]
MAATLAATTLVYSRSFGNGFLYDDWSEIVYNRYIGDWSFMWQSLVHDFHWFIDPSHLPQSASYRPLKNVWNALDFHLFGLNPAGYHATMLALYLVVVWLVFRTAYLLSGSPVAGLLAAALFAFIPVHAETVAYATDNEVLICAAFEFAAFIFYLRSLPGNGAIGFQRLRWRLGSLGLFGGALLAYEPAATFPLLVAAHAFIFAEGWNLREPMILQRVRAALLASWPYAAAVAAYLMLLAWIIHLQIPVDGMPTVDSATWAASQMISRTVTAYTLLLVMPWRAGPGGHWRLVGTVARLGFIPSVIGLAVLCGTAVCLLRRDPHRRLYLFCAVWFLVSLGPTFLSAAVTDRWLYFPSFGPLLMGADLAVQFGRGSKSKSWLVSLGAVSILIAYASILYSVQAIWHDDVSYWSWKVARYPKKASRYISLGRALETQGDLLGARHQFEAATLAPDPRAASFYELAHVDSRLGDRSAAARAMTEWINELEHPTPKAYVELALAEDGAGDEKGAYAALTLAGALPGGAETAAIADAHIRARHGDYAHAERILRSLLERHPENSNAIFDLGMVLSSEHRYDEALAIYRRALSNPSVDQIAHYRIALLLHALHRDREAHDECTLSLAQAPDDPQSRALMAELERGDMPR